jgi:hypothetical protein
MSKSREIIPYSLAQIRRNFGRMKLQIHIVSAAFRQNFGETTISFQRNKPLSPFHFGEILFWQNILFLGKPTPLGVIFFLPHQHLRLPHTDLKL